MVTARNPAHLEFVACFGVGIAENRRERGIPASPPSSCAARWLLPSTAATSATTLVHVGSCHVYRCVTAVPQPDTGVTSPQRG